MNAALPAGRMHAVTDPDDSSILNVVVVYDNLGAGQRGMSILASLVDQFRGARVEIRPRLWRFDLLDDPQWFNAALDEAIRADMLIVSTGSTNSHLPATVKGWLNQCLAGKQGFGGAIVALPGAADEPDTPRFQFLKSAAVEAGLDFFTPQSSVAAGASFPPAMELHSSARSIRVAQPFQHGGLNE